MVSSYKDSAWIVGTNLVIWRDWHHVWYFISFACSDGHCSCAAFRHLILASGSNHVSYGPFSCRHRAGSCYTVGKLQVTRMGWSWMYKSASGYLVWRPALSISMGAGSVTQPNFTREAREGQVQLPYEGVPLRLQMDVLQYLILGVGRL